MTLPVEYNPVDPADQKQIELLKNTIARGLTNEEFALFLQVAHRSKLDPFMRQIYPVKRKSRQKDPITGQWGEVEVMTIQTSIDGYRMIADQTGTYMPGKAPTYTYDKNGGVESATSYAKKLAKDGTWHEFSSTAYFKEYCQIFTDKNGNEKKGQFWDKMAHNQLAKCAEALNLRKGWPVHYSRLYTQEEMDQAREPIEVFDQNEQEPALLTSQSFITDEEAFDLDQMIGEDPEYKKLLLELLSQKIGKKVSLFCKVPREMLPKLIERIQNRNLKKEKEAVIA